tara:strand:- start:1250 stop:1354 length:105 start_codon:yes stop_codon:yes gene_type:complete
MRIFLLLQISEMHREGRPLSRKALKDRLKKEKIG